MSHECKYEEFIGKVKEFIENSKGFKTTLFTIALTVLLQVGTFLYLWGGLTTTVKNHDKSIDQLIGKLDKLKVIGYAVAGEVINDGREKK